MQIKVCGMRDRENIKDLTNLGIDMIGLNFYPLSSRYIPEDTTTDIVADVSGDISLVGVFVNEDMKTVLSIVSDFSLDYVQLHGDESSKYCRELSNSVGVIKVFRIAEVNDLEHASEYGFCDYFLFDTKTKVYGGSGKKFDWNIIESYDQDVPFFIAGGLGPDDSDSVKTLNHPQFVGLDLNSKFEDAPALKNVKSIEAFISSFKN